MTVWIWAVVLLVAAWTAHWGADRLARPLKKVRRQWGLTETAGAALLALVTASPEVGINVTSAVRGVSEIGLGNLLGSNIISIPLIVTVAYLASRRALTGRDEDDHPGHERHLKRRVLRLDRSSVTVLALPYLGILAVVALLTIPAGWRGLQPIDGWIMLAAYAAYLVQAVLRGREESGDEDWSRREILTAAAGVAAIAGGAYFVVRATEQLVGALGIGAVVGGILITGTAATAPEILKTWSVVRGGQVTAGTTSVIADNAVTMTLAFLPLALVSTPVQDLGLFVVNLVFVAVMPALYAAFVHFGSEEHGFRRWQVATFDGAYLVYLVVMLVQVMGVFGG